MEKNLYYDGYVIDYGNDEFSLERKRVDYLPNSKDRYFTLRDNDSLLALANYFYEDEYEWWMIAEVNNIFNPFELLSGQSIIIPNPDSL